MVSPLGWRWRRARSASRRRCWVNGPRGLPRARVDPSAFGAAGARTLARGSASSARGALGSAGAGAPARARPSPPDEEREGETGGAERREVWGAAIVARHYRDLARAVQGLASKGPPRGT